MSESYKFGLFDDMKHMALECANGVSRPLAEYAASAIDQSQRFYLPHGNCVVEGKEIRDLSYAIRLPFDRIAVLTEGVYEDTGMLFHRLICAEYLGDQREMVFYQTITRHRFGDDYATVVSPRYCFVVSESGDRLEYSLGPNSPEVISMFSDHSGEWPLQYNPDDEMHQLFGASDAATNLINLMVMLSLNNVVSERIEVPEKLAAKRRKRGKRPLYGYHVLRVDGERWSEPGVNSGDGLGYRSHLRRGHVRRISPGRAVWVRATFVHGRVAGFVDKDYQLDHAA